MKRINKLVLSTITLSLLLSCGIFSQVNAKSKAFEIKPLVGQSIDYTDDANWMFLEKNPKYDVDLFYLYPTVVLEGEGVAPIDEKHKKSAQFVFAMQGSAFASYTNVYAPYYRQAPLSIALKLCAVEPFEQYVIDTEIRTDVYTALDTYFTKYNNGRPFILAGHSQGSTILSIVIREYMKAHPEYQKRMVSAYLIGYPFTKDWFKKYNNVKFAKGETDTGVIVSWNTEGADATESGIMNPKGELAINPLNWKTNGIPAPASANKGSLIFNKETKEVSIVKGANDATIDTKRGTLICTTCTDYVPLSFVAFFGNKSLHAQDYQLYYENIKENGQKRIQAYLKKNKK